MTMDGLTTAVRLRIYSFGYEDYEVAHYVTKF